MGTPITGASYNASGGVVLSGQFIGIAPYYQHVGSGGITLSSSDTDFTQRHIILTNSSGGITLSSVSIIWLRPEVVGSGGISLTNRYTYRQNITNSYNFDFESSYGIQPYTEDDISIPGFPDDIIIDFTSGYSVGEEEKYWWRIQCCCKPAVEGEGTGPDDLEDFPEVQPFMPLKFNSSTNNLIEGLANNSIISPSLIKSLMPSISIKSLSLPKDSVASPNQKTKSRSSNKLNRSNGEISALYHEDDHDEEVLCQGIWNSGGSLTCGGNALSLISLVRAPTVNDVCAIIKAPMFGPEYLDIFSVLKIQKWVAEQRLWVDQEYCNAPNCITLCVDYAPQDDHAAFVMSVVENYNEADSTGGFSLSGSSEAVAIAGIHVAQGGISISGSLHSVISAAYSFNPNLIGQPPVSLGGSANIVLSHVNSRGGIVLSSSSIEVISPAHFYKSEGGLSIEGSGLDDLRFSISYDNRTYDLIFLTGSAEFTSLSKNFTYESEGGGVSLSGSSEVNSNKYIHDSDGMITVSGISETVSGRRQYQGEGGISIGGSSYLTRYVIASGGIAICRSGCDTESYFTFTHTGSGGVVLSGQVSGITSPSFNFESSGLGPITVTNDGVYVSYRDLGSFEDVFTAVMSTSNVSLNFGNDMGDGFSDLSINSGVINTCGCENVGLTVQLANNLSRVSEIGGFIQRNNLNSLDSLRLHYASGINSWNNVQHLSGLGADDTMQNWKFIFQLSCTNEIENVELDSFYFKFLLLVQKEVPSKNIKLKSMFLLNTDTSLICSGTTGLLSSTITFDTFEKIPFVDGNIMENFVYKDEIGIFSASAWNNKLDYSLIRDDLASGPVVSGVFPAFKFNVPIGQPLEYFMTLPEESIPQRQQQLLNSQIQNPLSQTDVDLKGQVETNVVSSNSNNVSTTTNNIFPSN